MSRSAHRRRDPVPSRPPDRGLHRRRAGPARGRAAGVPRVRQRGADRRGGARRAWPLAGRSGQGPPLRAANAAAEPRVLRRRRAVAGARHRRQRRDLQPDQRRDAADAAGEGAGAPRADHAHRLRTGDPASVSYPLFEIFRDNITSISGAFAQEPPTWRSTIDGDEEIRRGRPRLWRVLHACSASTPAAGRLLMPADDVLSPSSPAAVISERYWQRRFGRSPSAIGRASRSAIASSRSSA